MRRDCPLRNCELDLPLFRNVGSHDRSESGIGDLNSLEPDRRSISNPLTSDMLDTLNVRVLANIPSGNLRPNVSCLRTICGRSRLLGDQKLSLWVNAPNDRCIVLEASEASISILRGGDFFSPID